MKLFRRTLAALLSATMLLSAFPLNAISEDTEAPKTETSDPAKDSTVTSANGFQYSILPDGTAEICGYTGKNAVHLSVPDRIDGHVVTRLAVEAFARNETLQSVVIPATVKKIGNSAFYHCSSLKAIAFEGIGVEFGFTVAEGAISLKKVFCLDSHDLSGFCALLVTDMGQDVASGIEISAYADLPSLRNAYNAYVKPVSMQLGRPLLGAVTVSGDPIAEGTLGEDIVWVLESNGTLSVTGNGPMPDFSSQSSPWYTHRESILRVTLSDGITRVGACAFQNCNKIKTLSLPEGLTGIGSNAFYNCSSLQSLTLPSSLEGIDAQAFYNCDGITGGLTVPASVTYIKDSAFYDCNGFNGKLVIEENSGMTIGYRAFYNCQGFTSLELGTGVTSIG